MNTIILVLAVAMTALGQLPTALAGATPVRAIDRTRQAHARALAAFDASTMPALRSALAARVDEAAGQRYGHVSRLYWHTNLEEAKREAKALGRPILSLRLLGNLDEELTCANSRFFRVLYYANVEIRAILRDQFVLHWSSERPVPIVRIDFGDGHALTTTITGNSIHYVLDSRGQVVDFFPSLTLPQLFARKLRDAHALWARVDEKAGAERSELLQATHQARQQALAGALRRRPELARWLSTPPRVRDAQAMAITKAMVERQVTDRLLTPGVFENPTSLSVAQWRQLGVAIAAAHGVKPGPMFDADTRELVLELDPSTDFAALETNLYADAALSELVLSAAIADLGQLRFGPMETLNRVVYDEVFKTRRDDPWLNMRQLGQFAALPTKITMSDHPPVRRTR